MASPVLKVAEEGYDVTTADAKNLTIDSSKNQFKVLYEGEQTFSLNSGNSYTYTKTVTHSFGYRPQVIGWSYTVEPNDDNDDMIKKSKFSLMPSWALHGTSPMTASFVATIERSTSTVKFKFYEDDGWKQAGENPAFYTLTDMKLRYLIFVDAE
jgi:hypothetical protein